MNTYASRSTPFSPPYIPSQEAVFVDTDEALEIRITWGERLLEHTHFYHPKKITLGDSQKDTFTLETAELLPPDTHSMTLIETKGDQMMVHLTEKMEGSAWIKDRWYTLEQIKQSPKTAKNPQGYSFALPTQSKLYITVGQLELVMGRVSVPKPIGAGAFQQMDQSMARAFAMSFLLHGLAVMFMLLSDESPRGLDESFFKQTNRFGNLIVRPPVEEEKPTPKSSPAPAKGEASRMGSTQKDARERDRRSATIERNIDGTAHLNMKTIEQEVFKKIKGRGMLGLLGGGQSVYNNLINAKAKGGDDIDIIGGLQGTFAGLSKGNGGLALRGGGKDGGGGINGTSIGVGPFGTFSKHIGRCNLTCRRGKLRAKSSRQLIVSGIGKVQVEGTLDKEIIRRMINKHRRRFKYCYENELRKYPRLQGKIKVFFQIEGDGRVVTARVKHTTMNNENVEGCLVRRVKIMRFPAPKGGGIVQVNYPFFFKPS